MSNTLKRAIQPPPMSIRGSLISYWQATGHALCRLHMFLQDRRDYYPPSSRQRRLMVGTAAIVCLGLLAASTVHAQDGIAGMATTAGTQADSIKISLGKIFAAAGFGGAGLGGWNWWRKGKEGDQSHIKGSQIIVPIAAGAALGAIGFVMIKAGETIGIQRSELGNVPT